MQITYGEGEQDGHLITLSSGEMIEAAFAWLRASGVFVGGAQSIRVCERPLGPHIPVRSDSVVTLQVYVPADGSIDIKTPGAEGYKTDPIDVVAAYEAATQSTRQRMAEMMAEDDSPEFYAMTADSYRLLLDWIDRAEELADELEDTKLFKFRRREDLRSGIQERLQCLRDLFLLSTDCSTPTASDE